MDQFEYEDRCDSKLQQEDLKKLEIELKKKQKKRIKRAQGVGRVRQQVEEVEEEERYDEEGNPVRQADRQYVDRLLDDDQNEPLLLRPREYPERSYLGGLVR